MTAVDLDALLDRAVAENASDVHLAVGRPPVFRRHGRLVNAGDGVLSAEETAAIAARITPERLRKELEEAGGADFAIPHGEKARFRVSILRQKGVIGIVLRQIPSRIIPIDELGLPPVVAQLATKPRGLVLVTGPTGSGKTTTLAAMIDLINRTDDRHIITVEDPIEYTHGHGKSVITQREIGVDVPSFSEALRRALRQDPDVILVGEMRDLETIQAAITAAETGHLVFGTLHTRGAAETVTRIIDAFPPNQQEQIRQQLASSLVAVISQALLPTADGKGRVAAFEIMVMTPAVGHLIRENKAFRIPSEIQTGKRIGMVLLDESLAELARSGKITREEALGSAAEPEALEKALGGAPYKVGGEEPKKPAGPAGWGK